MIENLFLVGSFIICVIAVVFILFILTRYESINELERKIEELEYNFECTAESIVDEIDMLYESVIDNKCSCNKDNYEKS